MVSRQTHPTQNLEIQVNVTGVLPRPMPRSKVYHRPPGHVWHGLVTYSAVWENEEPIEQVTNDVQ